MENIWTDANGVKTPFNELSHQHLSNILWYYEVFYILPTGRVSIITELQSELERRFNGNRRFWKPIPVLSEIEDLKNMGLINETGHIIGNRHCGIHCGKVIGSIHHIENHRHHVKTIS
jgi:hypothetical protein